MSRDFRYSDDTGFERRCPACVEWWPMSLEFWDRRWMTRCRACVKAWRRHYQNAKYRDNPEFRQVRKDAARLSWWKAMERDPVKLKTRKADYDDQHRERRRELQRLNYWARRDDILAKRRARKERAA